MIKALICGGGTGGHFFSGVAVAEKFLTLYPDGEVVFIGTKNGIEGRTNLQDPRMKQLFIFAKGLKGKGLQAKMVGALYLALGVLQSFFILFRERPRFVIGVGGYASAPTVFAGLLTRWILRFKLLVLDQNSVPGLVNRIFSRLPVLAYCPFPAKGFQLVDLPIRQKMAKDAENARPIHWPPQTIFILGGSQGARGLNRVWMDAFPLIRREFPTIRVIHQSGTADEQELTNFYRSQQVNAEVFAFSSDMSKYLAQADVLIARSGAMTVFEILAFKRPVIFVPFPAATDQHQRKNALAVQSAEWVIDERDFNAERVLRCLKATSPSYLQRPHDDIESWDRILQPR